MGKNDGSKTLGDKFEKLRLESELENNRQDNKSRSRIAYGFTFAFIAFIAIILIGGPIYNAIVDESKSLDIFELITTFVAQFGTPLGFVLGYYFKDKNN